MDQDWIADAQRPRKHTRHGTNVIVLRLMLGSGGSAAVPGVRDAGTRGDGRGRDRDGGRV